MKIRIISVLLAALLVLVTFTGCGEMQKTDDFHIVCTIFPIYDWVKSIVKDAEGVRVSLIVSDGSDLHSYNASASDIINISTCDMLVMAGGDSDVWVEAALSQAKNKEITVLRLLDVLDARGMAYAADGEHEHSEGEECHHALDEHFWLSPKAARALCGEIFTSLCERDSENAEKYTSNFSHLEADLIELDELCNNGASTVDAPLVFADRFAFKYLFLDYDIPYVAAFSSCSADTDATFETVKELSEALDSSEAEKIYVTESALEGVAEAVISASQRGECEIVSINSMQSITANDVENGASYVEIMRENIDKLFE